MPGTISRVRIVLHIQIYNNSFFSFWIYLCPSFHTKIVKKPKKTAHELLDVRRKIQFATISAIFRGLLPPRPSGTRYFAAALRLKKSLAWETLAPSAVASAT